MVDLLPDLPALSWVLLGLAAFGAGLSKSALPGLGTLSVVLGAAALPARESTGMLLLLFILGDIFAVWTYARDADWKLLIRLAPTVVLGVLVGAAFLAVSTDRTTGITIGIILIGLIAMTLFERSRVSTDSRLRSKRFQSILYGSMGGFTTMVANAGAPPMSLYFLAQRLEMITFLGTSAWFFAVINLVKLPFSIGIGLVTPPILAAALVLLPGIALGFGVGRMIITRINQQLFDRLVMAATIIGALYLIIASG